MSCIMWFAININDPDGKFDDGIIDTGGKFAASVNNTRSPAVSGSLLWMMTQFYLV